jgi:uncharacterized membrane protein YcaP (DUF421 family)
MDPLRIVIRVLFAYLVALVLVRIAGHREIKQVDIHSFIVALIMGDLFDDLFWLEVPAAQFVVALGSLFVVHIVASLQWFHAGRRAWPLGRRR